MLETVAKFIGRCGCWLRLGDGFWKDWVTHGSFILSSLRYYLKILHNVITKYSKKRIFDDCATPSSGIVDEFIIFEFPLWIFHLRFQFHWNLRVFTNAYYLLGVNEGDDYLGKECVGWYRMICCKLELNYQTFFNWPNFKDLLTCVLNDGLCKKELGTKQTRFSPGAGVRTCNSRTTSP